MVLNRAILSATSPILGATCIIVLLDLLAHTLRAGIITSRTLFDISRGVDMTPGTHFEGHQMLTDANEPRISDKPIGVRVFVSLGVYDRQKTTEQSEESFRLEPRTLDSGLLSATYVLGKPG